MYSMPQQPRYVKKFIPGTVIATEGDTSNEMYVLLDGNAGVYKNYLKGNQQELETLGPSNFFGEASLFINMPRHASLVALNEVTAICVDRTNVLQIFAKQPEMSYAIIGELCRRIASANMPAQAAPEKIIEKQTPPATPVQATAVRQTMPAPAQTPVQAKPAAPPVAPAQTAAPAAIPSKKSKLFPEGHGSYVLPFAITNESYLYEQKCTCPLCGQEFEHLTALSSRLRRIGTDRDMRVRYADVEPMYYDVISCPYCLYSATVELFPTASKRSAERIMQELGEYRDDVVIQTGRSRDAFTIFAGYYLALKSVPLCFDEHQLKTGSLWQKLSRLYKDCEDDNMYKYASEKAIADYEHVYGHFRISDKQTQQICFVLGDLYERIGDYFRAQENFFRVKSMTGGTPAFKLQADRRLDEVKALMKSKK